MKTLSLNGSWKLAIPDSDFPAGIEASVPGSVYNDLLRAGLIDDPFWRDNERAALRIMEHDFVYTRTFCASTEQGLRYALRFDGLDTIADIRLNGQLAGHADNMHRIWELDVTDILKNGENELQVTLYSPTRYIAEKEAEVHVGCSGDAMPGFPHIRKAHCMFGWDWGPRLPDAGIWRDASLLCGYENRISDVIITQKHGNGHVRLDFDIKTQGGFSGLAVTLITPDGTEISCAKNGVGIENPQLWWPRGYGEQPLYTVRIEMMDGGETLDCCEKRIGLRTMELRRERDEWGESFAHAVNGVPVFAMGADYIPEDSILPRVDEKRTRKLLEDAAKANFNAIRVWGGGYYPDDWFYDICDELGLLVWQDFMFSCAVYELTPALEANIRAEVKDNAKRLRHHASLALWCGNNELEWQVDDHVWGETPKQKADYIRIFEYIIPDELNKHNTETPYWPASPSSGGGFDKPNDENRGDAHYWDVWHGGKPFAEYRKFFFRYASEFGFQSFPCLKTIESFTLPEDRNIFSRIMELHQRSGVANAKILNYTAATYLYPLSFDTLLYATQLLQADAIRYGVEHWRRNRGRCMGAVYWQLNDCWPVASWASIDYFGRWKALHYAAKRFFAPVLLSCEEMGEVTQRPAPTMLPGDIEISARLSVANETRQAFCGTVEWALKEPCGNVLENGSFAVNAPALESVWMPKLDFSSRDPLNCYISYKLYDGDGNAVSNGAALFTPPKHFAWRDPALKAERRGDTITVTSQSFAKSVEICGDGDFLLSDNFFDMDAGSVSVKILEGDPQNLTVRSVFDIGR